MSDRIGDYAIPDPSTRRTRRTIAFAQEHSSAPVPVDDRLKSEAGVAEVACRREPAEAPPRNALPQSPRQPSLPSCPDISALPDSLPRREAFVARRGHSGCRKVESEALHVDQASQPEPGRGGLDRISDRAVLHEIQDDSDA